MTDSLPLDGYRVLEIGAYISGPFCGALLASLGADVVKIEPPGGEPFRRGNANRDHFFMQYNAGKRSMTVNLKTPEGIQLIKKLLPGFDVLLENNRPGILAKLGLGAEVCRAINPRLVYTSVSGFGDGGPLRDRPAYDTIGQAIAGNYSLMNDAGEAKMLGGAISDLISAVAATTGTLAALLRRAGDDNGVEVKTSLMEAMSLVTVDAITSFYERGVTPIRTSRHPQAQSYCLPTADKGAVVLHMSVTEKFWENLCVAMEQPQLATDARFATYRDRLENYFVLEPILRGLFLARDRAEWERRLLDADVPYAPVLTIEEVVHHPQTHWLDLMEPERNGLSLVRPPWRFDDARPQRAFDAPLAGEHSEEIAAEVLTSDEIADLRAKGVFGARPEPVAT